MCLATVDVNAANRRFACPRFQRNSENFYMPDRAYLHPIDPELIPGARNAINVCLRLKPEERITFITDTATREIAAALQTEVERVGSDYSLFVLEHHARRPLKFMPEIILDDLARSQVSIFAAQTQPGELTARTQMTRVVKNWAAEVCGGRIISCMEGGYNLETLGETVRAHVEELQRV